MIYKPDLFQEMKKIVDMINYEIEYVLRPHTAPARFPSLIIIVVNGIIIVLIINVLIIIVILVLS